MEINITEFTAYSNSDYKFNILLSEVYWKCIKPHMSGTKKTYFRFSNGAVITCLRVTVYGTNAAARALLITVEIMSW